MKLIDNLSFEKIDEFLNSPDVPIEDDKYTVFSYDDDIKSLEENRVVKISELEDELNELIK